MNASHSRHLDTELLSAYLDREVTLRETRALEAHLETCPACRRKLDELQRTVGSLTRLERAAPPPWLDQRVRRALEAPPPSFWERFVIPLLQVPLRSPIGSTLSMAVALGIILLGASAGQQANPRAFINFTNFPGPVDDPNWLITPTTIEVADREFVLRDDDVWVEKGLFVLQPESSITVSSPEGRALLARYQDLGYLLADGSKVVMRYQTETLELWSGT
jgi:putative zinc finger protein